MILPGISGSFILVLMGAYQVILAAASDRDIKILAIFGSGCILGLLAFSKLLNYLFKNFKNFTIAVLTGFLIGSLNKVWPWKHVTEIYVKHAGEVNEKIVPIAETNVLPNNFDVYMRKGDQIIGHVPQDPQLLYSILLAVAGVALIVILEKFGNKAKS
jgi:putative membrane protein